MSSAMSRPNSPRARHPISQVAKSLTPPATRPHARPDARAIPFALEYEYASEAQGGFSGGPGVRHVGDLPGAPRITPRDLRPLVPGQWATIRQEELRQLEGARPASETHQRADDAD